MHLRQERELPGVKRSVQNAQCWQGALLGTLGEEEEAPKRDLSMESATKMVGGREETRKMDVIAGHVESQSASTLWGQY